ncbi:hypothetical protein [Methylovirgula sp. HY1]|nr:hypothetical protein [Methylovirgula sp. HY1]
MLLIETPIRERAMVQAEQSAVLNVGQVLARRDDQPSQGEG